MRPAIQPPIRLLSAIPLNPFGSGKPRHARARHPRVGTARHTQKFHCRNLLVLGFVRRLPSRKRAPRFGESPQFSRMPLPISVSAPKWLPGGSWMGFAILCIFVVGTIKVHFPDNPSDIEQIVLRWTHLAGGIAWAGLLYFFNLVNVPFQKELDPATRGKV